MSDENELPPLEEANKREREITLGAINDPEGTKLADGTPFLEAQKTAFEEQTKEGQKTLELQRQRVREQSTGTDPLYQGKVESLMGAPGTFTVIPDSEEKQQERMRNERMKRSTIVNKEESKKETHKQSPITTQPPEKIISSEH